MSGNIVPRSDLQGSLGTGAKRWGAIYSKTTPVIYDTLAAMKADVNLTSGLTAFIKGHLAVNDGGAVLYSIREANNKDAYDDELLILLNNGNVAEHINFDGYAASYYGICSTDAATVAKTVACASFKLVTGSRIVVKFTVTNTATSPTLNVNSTGAKAIQYHGAAISSGYLVANRTYEFVYDGTNYQLIGDIDTNTTNSAGADNSMAKLFLVGTTAQSTGTSYSNANVYATNGALHAISINTDGNIVVGGTANTNYLQLPSGIKLY